MGIFVLMCQIVCMIERICATETVRNLKRAGVILAMIQHTLQSNENLPCKPAPGRSSTGLIEEYCDQQYSNNILKILKMLYECLQAQYAVKF